MMTSYKKRTVIILFIAVFFVILDRFLKSLAMSDYLFANFSLFGSIFSFNFVPNYNIAFSLPLAGLGLNVLILLIIAILLYFFVYLLDRKDKTSYYIGFVLLGAISNYFDRIQYGYVIDYFDLKYFTVFNVADIMIVVGCLLLLINEVKKEK